MNKIITLFAILAIGFTSCVKQDFDIPPVEGEDPGLTATHTIRDILDLFQEGQITEITEPGMIVKGTIIADDESGNFYRNFVVQDETGGIVVRLNLTDAWVFYKEGREVFIKCEGLFINDFAGVVQLGGYVYEEEGRMEMGDITNYNEVLIRGKRTEGVEPNNTTISQLGINDISTLITLDDVQFVGSDVGETISDPIGPSTLNRYVEDCFGAEIVLRSSGFSNFAADIIPNGRGSITGVYSQFNDTRQILIRSIDDIAFDKPRCGADGPGEVDPVEELFEDFQALQDDQDVFLNGWTNVVANGDRVWEAREFQGNVYALGSAFAGSGNPGVEMDTWLVTPPILMNQTKYLNFLNATAFYTHNSLSVWIAEDYDGVDVSAANWVEITNEFTIAGSGDSNYAWVESGEYEINSSAETIHVAFRYVGGGTDTGSGILDDISISNESGGGGGNNGGGNDDPVSTINEDFSSVADDDDIDVDGWYNLMPVGPRLWRANEFDNNTYAQATAYAGSSDPGVEMETWMITPAILMDNDKTMSFRNATAFYTHDGLTVWMAEDFDGTNVQDANWTEITNEFTLAGAGQANYDWVESGSYNFSSSAETVHIAFRYIGGPGQTGTFIIDDVIVDNQ